MFQRKLLLFLAPLALVAGACSSPRIPLSALGAKPGWGRGFTPEERELTVRAVPASAAPSAPETRNGRPGWGNPIPAK
ncbi:MAG: hypothetical protein HOP15_06585 [Planctomycetes bacterium]|nr:hypothetical protein [Planctomycetota bacterium]